jgi:hypothetical protein
LQSQIDSARTELKGLEVSRFAKIEEFRHKELSGQKQKDDPLARMTAYQELKNDPKDGATIIWFSWMTKLLVIFLEVVPVVAKMFFSPPSVYAARIQAEVARQSARARRDSEEFRQIEREVESPVLKEIDARWSGEIERSAKADVVRKARSRAAVE